MGWKLISDNVTSQAQGLIRLSDRSSPQGVRLEIATPSLSRLIGSDVAGPTAYSGVFKGDAQTWTLQGQASLLNANLASYRATRIAGPLNIQVRDGRMELEEAASDKYRFTERQAEAAARGGEGLPQTLTMLAARADALHERIRRLDQDLYGGDVAANGVGDQLARIEAAFGGGSPKA